MDDYFVWCGSVIRAEDGRYPMFASRWPKATKFPDGYRQNMDPCHLVWQVNGFISVTTPHRVPSLPFPRPPPADGEREERGERLRLAGEPDSPVAQGHGGLTHGPARRRSTRH